MKLLLITLTLFVLITSSYLDCIDAHASAFCQGKCKVRCSKAGQRSRCMKYCLLCCEECKCVPSGTYGHKDECPCYRDKVAKGHKRKPKCP